nr:MMPL family transporter [Actinomadura madurae]
MAGVVLLVTFGSLAAAGLPLLTALIGIGVSLAGILALAHALDLSATTSILAMMLGLAVGIDYALFVVSRYREERARGRAPREAVGLAVGTAGSAVVFAGLTVVIALAGLSVVGIPMLTKMGLAAAGAVTIAVLIALTLVPALLGFWPNAVLTRRARKGGRIEERSTPNDWCTRWARLVLRRPLPVLLLGVVVLGGSRAAGHGPSARQPRGRGQTGLHHRAPGVRCAGRGVRAGLQRPTDHRRGRPGQHRREGRRRGCRAADRGHRGCRIRLPGPLQQGG